MDDVEKDVGIWFFLIEAHSVAWKIRAIEFRFQERVPLQPESVV